MRKQLFAIALLLGAVTALQAQQRDYRVVFDLTSSDIADHHAVVHWVNEIASSDPNAKVEVVMYGQSLNAVVKDRSTEADAIEELLKNKNVSFKVCAIAMKAHHLDKSQLLPGVETVPDGIYEIISRQRDGWGYIKAVH